jgi:Transmembrane domain of unknown function (DUF3566)
MTGNFAEEDGVDHRVEPQSWVTEEASADPGPVVDQLYQDGANTVISDRPSGAGGFQATVPSAIPDTPPAPAAPPAAPPYPAQLSGTESSSGPSTSTFSLLNKAGRPPKAPKAPKPPRPPKPPKAAKPPRPAKLAAERQPMNGKLPARRAQLAVIRLEPWSVMKFSFMISLVGWVVLFVFVAALYYVLSKLGVFHSIETSVTNVTSGKDSPGVQASNWFSASKVLGYTMLIGAVNVILFTALATLGSVIYNLVTHVAGGIEVTLKETD